MIKRIWRFLINKKIVPQRVQFVRYVDKINNTVLKDDSVKDLWEKDDTKVHESIEFGNIQRIAEYIIKVTNLKKTDTVLDIGCGDGLVDEWICDNVKKLYGFDFSSNKLEKAEKMNLEATYWEQSFLDVIDNGHFTEGRPNKIFAFSVTQYCVENDLKRYFENQIDALNSGKGYVYALDVPDVAKAYEYYHKIFPKVSRKVINDKMASKKKNAIFEDGSYWVDISYVKELLCDYNEIVSISIVEGLSAYRSSVIVECNKG